MSIASDLRDYVYDEVDTAFGVAQVIDVGVAERVNIRFLLQQWEEGGTPGLELPYAVCVWGQDRRIDGGPVNGFTFERTIEVFYVMSIRDGSDAKTSEEIYSEIEDKCLLLSKNLFNSQSYNVADVPEIDTSNRNPANAYFLQNNMPLYAGSVMARILIGES